ncbi:Glycosyltransferase, catalytic subunit of cellulose synthase and poly-beta-1,6-N-acetylglucosamine synthase [Gracilibacillus orientalis]|uniref:Glycosyltransferase, catalytic subunit of cellulose synthase and poly-beta-1,6-N-acetylglucosamine synthase n=1 Tax=Gracilibacillus orientalis TaxID=334253 RepID=A0A1I4LJC8_9BACI|nr:glycosyltransferase [Gracilibacillus orientalis]SFL91115.1 Glycosyltransferase, catalytic subunit of cellulose synthase and poly-beta-1,6-N-acetylglucosamine synthase [Gracilibacillus orientalis]
METFLFILFYICIFFPILHLLHCLPWFRVQGEDDRRNPKSEKGVSILIPCFNEAGIIKTSVNSMKSLDYQNFEVIYVNDGSSDDTFPLLYKNLELEQCWKTTLNQLPHQEIESAYQSKLYPYIFVVNKVNGGKADALNAGIECSTKELVVTLDADTILTESALHSINNTFDDENVIAAGGMVHVLQAKTSNPLNKLTLTKANVLLGVQMLDFLKAFYVTKISLARFQGLAIISGAFGIFNRELLVKVGGYRSSVGEDIDITLKIQRYISKKKHEMKNKKIVLIKDAISYTELPETWIDLFKQRIRWQKGYIDCLVHFMPFLLRTVLTRAVSFFYIAETLVVAILAAYVTIGVFTYNAVVNFSTSLLSFVLIYLLYIIIFNLVYDILAILQVKRYGFTFQKKQVFRLFLTILYDVFIHRFVTMYFVLYGSIAYFFNKDWKKVKRTGRNYETDMASEYTTRI